MSADFGYRTRLKVRIGKSLSTSATSLKAQFSDRDVTVKSNKPDQPLREASWLVIAAHGFDTECKARKFGEKLRRAAHMAGLCTLVGVDGRALGDDRTTTHFSAAGQEWLRSRGALQANEQLIDDIHGLTVLPDDENIRVVDATAAGRVLHDARDFIIAIEEAVTEAVSQDVEHAIHVLNLAYINQSPLAKVVLAVSSIEALAQTNDTWTPHQRQIIDRAIEYVEAEFADGDGAHEVAVAIRRMHQYSLRQQAKQLMAKHDLMALWRDWEDVYGRRSSLFHGGANREHGDVVEFAGHALKVCGTIVLSIAQRQGAVLPTSARVHFGVPT